LRLADLLRRKELITFIALSLVSLFADMTYEGARSVLGAYLEVLEATAVVAGVVSVGDLLGYLMRGVGGFIAGLKRSSRVYWALVFGGYTINLVAVPLLAFAGRWGEALCLVLLERVGKGLRAPARDVILSEVTEGIGRGKGFGIHELMDQVGAVSGPLLVTWSLFSSGGEYRAAFLLLAIPALLALCLLCVAYVNYPSIRAVHALRRGRSSNNLDRSFWFFTIGTAMLSTGYVHWALAAYRVEASALAPSHIIALLYTIAMLVDAAVALPAGMLYDRYGPATLVAAPVLAGTASVLILTGGYSEVVLASMIWGVVMGLYETNMRAAVADLSSPTNRAYAYGVYGVVFGVSWTLGNVFLAKIMTSFPCLLLPYIVIVESIAACMLVLTVTTWHRRS